MRVTFKDRSSADEALCSIGMGAESFLFVALASIHLYSGDHHAVALFASKQDAAAAADALVSLLNQIDPPIGAYLGFDGVVTPTAATCIGTRRAAAQADWDVRAENLAAPLEYLAKISAIEETLSALRDRIKRDDD